MTWPSVCDLPDDHTCKKFTNILKMGMVMGGRMWYNESMDFGKEIGRYEI